MTLTVGPLSLGAIRRLLSERLGLSLQRQHLRRVVETTLGNPLFALEIGRSFVELGVPPPRTTSPFRRSSRTCSARAWQGFRAG